MTHLYLHNVINNNRRMQRRREVRKERKKWNIKKKEFWTSRILEIGHKIDGFDSRVRTQPVNQNTKSRKQTSF